MFKKIKQALKKSWDGFGGWGAGGGPYTFLLSTMNTWGPFGSGVNTPWKYDMYSWLGYSSNPIVSRCCNLISSTVSSVPWKLYHKRADGKDVHIDDHPVLKLIQNPSPLLSENEFITQYINTLLICGNVYVHRVGPNHGPPKELYFLRPDRIIILNAEEGIDVYNDFGYDGFPFRPPVYEYVCGKSRSIIPNEMLHHGKLFNPLCDFYGLSMMQAAATSIDQNNEALLWNVNLLRNAAAPTGILKTENNLGDEQISRLKEQMRQKMQGPYNAGGTTVLEGGLEWERLSLTPLEIAWAEGMKMSANNICTAFGVDPSLLGLSERKGWGYRDAQKSLYTETVIPLCDSLRDNFFNKWLLPLFPNTSSMYFQYDLEQVEVLNEDRSIVWERVIKGMEAGIITQEEAREAIGYDILETAMEQENDMDTDVMDEEENEGIKIFRRW